MRPLLTRALACAALSALPIRAKTFEGFNLSAGLVAGANNPYLEPVVEHMGHGYLFLGPGVNLFENRLTIQTDVGLSDQAAFTRSFAYAYTRYRSARDTLFRINEDLTSRQEVYQMYWSYRASLNAGAWSFFAGEIVRLRLYVDTDTGTVDTDYATAADGFTYHPLSSRPESLRYAWGSALVFPLYGVARRFGRFSVWLQGVGLISLQAGVGVSLKPLGPIGPHR